MLLSIVFAHKHARLLRRSVNELDWLRRVHGIEDTAISITNAIVRAYGEAILKNPANAVNVIELALSIYFGGRPAISANEEIKIRDALLALSQLRGRDMPNNMKGIWKETMNYLKKASSGKNIDLNCSSEGEKPQFSRFADFLRPKQRLMFGHYHQPREADPAYDAGGFVGSVKTSFTVRPDGSTDRNP
jgi:hypothetical protein